MTEPILQSQIDRINLDPCTPPQMRGNWQLIKQTFQNLTQIITGDTSGGVTGSALVFFRISGNHIGQQSAPAQELAYNSGVWIETGVQLTVYDWTSALYRMNFADGMVGVGRLRKDIAEEPAAVEVLAVEGWARWIDVTLTSDIIAQQATATVGQAWGAYPNVREPNSPLVVHDRYNLNPDGEAGELYLAVWDEQSQQYVLTTTKRPDTPPPEPDSKPVDIVKITGGSECADATPNLACVWPGARQSAHATAGTACGDIWDDGGNVWVVDIRHCDAIGTLVAGERYLAVDLAFSLTYLGDTRPVMGVQSDLSVASDDGKSAVIKIYNGGADCEQVEQNGNCLVSAVLQGWAPGNDPVACASSDGIDVWAVPLSNCQCLPISPPNGARYVAVRITADWGPEGQRRPLYAFDYTPPSTAIVEVDGTSCDSSPPDSNCLISGKIKTHPAGSANFCNWDDGDACWINPINQCDSKNLKSGERYLGSCSGTIAGQPVFSVMAIAPALPERPRWGKCLTNWWHHAGVEPMDYVMVTEVDGPEVGAGAVALDEDSPAYRDDIGTEPGYQVFLPKNNAQDPNLELDDRIAFATCPDGKMVCVSDYLDDKIWTVKMAAKRLGASAEVNWVNLKGWLRMTGAQYSEIDMQEKFPRGATSEGQLGQGAGKEVLSRGELNHTHDLHTTSIAEVFQDGGTKVPLWDSCIETNAHGFDNRDDNGDVVPPNPEFPPGPCELDWGPLNIMNPYKYLDFWERQDNSENPI